MPSLSPLRLWQPQHGTALHCTALLQKALRSSCCAVVPQPTVPKAKGKAFVERRNHKKKKKKKHPHTPQPAYSAPRLFRAQDGPETSSSSSSSQRTGFKRDDTQHTPLNPTRKRKLQTKRESVCVFSPSAACFLQGSHKQSFLQTPLSAPRLGNLAQPEHKLQLAVTAYAESRSAEQSDKYRSGQKCRKSNESILECYEYSISSRRPCFSLQALRLTLGFQTNPSKGRAHPRQERGSEKKSQKQGFCLRSEASAASRSSRAISKACRSWQHKV